MHTQHIETLIIGAGQAGLATGYHLKQRGRDFVIVDGAARVGDNWRCHWDSLRLYTPAKYDGLPGMPFPADPWHFPGKDEVAAFLEQYALGFDLPVRMGTRVRRLAPNGEHGFVATLDNSTMTCDNVVVATGSFGRTPFVPDAASDLDPSIRQLHSSEYHHPADLRSGRVLVVGASHSGADIAYELAGSHPTVLCGRDCGNIPFRPEAPKAHVLLPLAVFAFRHLLTRRTPMGRKQVDDVRLHGGPALRVKAGDLAERGVERIPARFVGVQEGLPLLDDGTVVNAANVVWCTGFRQAFDWIDVPVVDDNGWPREYRGVADDVPGLYFCGLSFQYAFASMVFPGVGRDAAYLARHIAARTPDRSGIAA